MPFAEVKYQTNFYGRIETKTTRLLFRSGDEAPVILDFKVKCSHATAYGVKHDIAKGQPVYQITATSHFFCAEHYKELPRYNQIESYLRRRNRSTFIRLVEARI